MVKKSITIVGKRSAKNNRRANLKRRVRRHLQKKGLGKNNEGELVLQGDGKDSIRSLHQTQRNERLEKSSAFIENKSGNLLRYFATGQEIDPSNITPVVQRVTAGTEYSDLFKLASFTWSVPVSNGFGRRLRYIIWDQSNEKLMGLLAIGDPVFNLSARDKLIGWDVDDRRSRLVNIMDAYVLGAVPPYNALLGGKLIACLLRSRELYDDFRKTYGNTEGIISGKNKKARLLAVTTSSSMGRSSVYNRLKLDGIQYLRSVGYTGGWGHFHVPDKIFSDLRNYLREQNHEYANAYRYGQGPNWRLRATRKAFTELGFKQDLLRHGIKREVFISFLASNAIDILQTGTGKPNLESLLSTHEIAELAIKRWMLPRAARRPEFQNWTIKDLVGLFGCKSHIINSNVDRFRKSAK
ncbi:MAG: Druantia anti-phage system protein DruA [Parvularculales bacterium]